MPLRGGGEIEVFWETHEECGADYDLLFRPLQVAGLVVRRVDRPWLLHARKRNLYFPEFLRRFAFDVSWQGREIREMDIYELARGKRRIYIEGSNEFCRYKLRRSLALYFRPTEELEQRIEAVTRQFASQTVGIHIRRTDHTDAIRCSPLEAFISMMDNRLALAPDTMFYVATDDEAVKTSLFARYTTDHVISPRWELRRDTVRGMQDAVVDLYCLGKTNEIWGSHFSTYSEDAAALYDIPLTIVGR